MVVEVPMIASIQPTPEPALQHVIVPMIAWPQNGFYQAPLPHASYQAAPVANTMWMPPMTSCEAPWQQGHTGYTNCFVPCLPSDGGSTKPSSRQSRSPRSHKSTRSDASSQESNARVGPWSADGDSTINTDSYVTVVLGHLPKLLCSHQCFAAAIEQSRLDGVVTYEVEDSKGSDGGEAVVILTNEVSAQLLMHHFQGLRWGKSRPIVARYCAAAGRRLLARREPGQNSDHEENAQDESSQLQVSKQIVKLRKKLCEIQRLKKFPAEQLDVTQRRKVEAEAIILSQLADLGDTVPQDQISLKADDSMRLIEIKESVCTGTGVAPEMKMKKLWADFGSDDDLGDDCQSTFAGSFEFEMPDPSDREDL